MGAAGLAFLGWGSSGLATFSKVVFLLEEDLLEEGGPKGASTATCLGTCLVGAFPLALVVVSSGEETISSTYWGSCSEGLVDLGVLRVL